MIADNPHCCLISIHTPLAGSDRQPADHAVGRHISIHTPLAGSDRQCRVDGETLGISIHTPLAGSDMSPAISGAAFLFQSTLPLWGATSFRRFLIYVITFQSTLPLRGATGMGRRNRHRKGISIHTPLAGSDRAASGLRGLQAIISIHTPLAGSDAALRKCWRSLIFQSTLPLRGATRPDNWTIWPTGYFNPHSPCGERRGHARHQRHPRHFNPHSPCGERQEDLENFRQLLEFQSTLPLRGATGHCHTLLSGHAISIHTPLAGSDLPIARNPPISR